MLKIIIISKNENAESIGFNLKLYKYFDIYLVSPNAAKTKYNAENLTKINDSDLLCYETLRQNLKIERFGWYFQQFLKFESVLRLEGDEFMIIDGDTVVDQSLAISDTFFSINRRTNAEYIKLYESFFPNDKIINQYLITNQMVFKKSLLNELIADIEKQSGLDWKRAISNVINETDESACAWFSEYQMYANYVLNRYTNTSIKPVKVFRRFDLIDDKIENGLRKYNIIAYENYHKSGFFRKMRAKFYYLLSVNLG
jgi:hypothetical protein